MSSQVFSTPRQGLNARQAETVERLMTAGSEELRAVGHEALTIRTVANRAGVSPATAYTYLASKNHLFAELFRRFLLDDVEHVSRSRNPVTRVQGVTSRMAGRLSEFPELAAAVTPALLGSDPDASRIRLQIGAEFVRRFEAALGDRTDPALLDALLAAYLGILLQAGMGLMTYAEMGARLDSVVATIMKGHS